MQWLLTDFVNMFKSKYLEIYLKLSIYLHENNKYF